MISLRTFLEHRVSDQIKFKDNKTNKEIVPSYIIYDEESLQSILNRYKQNKESFKDLSIYFAYNKNNSWIIQTNLEYNIDISRINDKFLYSNKIDYGYDDIVSLLEDGKLMIVIL